AKDLSTGKSARHDGEEQECRREQDSQIDEVIAERLEDADAVVDRERDVDGRAPGDGRLERRHHRVGQRTADRLIRHDRRVVVPHEGDVQCVEIRGDRGKQQERRRDDRRQPGWLLEGGAGFGHRLIADAKCSAGPQACPKISGNRGGLMTSRRSLVAVGLAAALAGGVAVTRAPRLGAQSGSAAAVNWPLHNLDLAGSRFSSMTQIDRTNVNTLVPRWLFQHGVIDGVSNQTTPVVVDGRMFVTDSRGSVYALDAADGHLLWSYD